MSGRVVITDSNYPDADIERRVLSEVDAEVVRADASTPADVVEAADGADALLNQNARLTETVFEALDEVKVVSRYGIGVDNVDVDAATAHGVLVCNVPSYCEDEVATHALALLFACARKITRYDESVKRGNWDWKVGQPMQSLTGSTLGLVAFGKIPQNLSGMVEGFDFDCVAYDPYRSAEEMAEHGVEKVDFGELLTRSDVVSIHAPLNDETERLFDEAAFSKMRDDAILINTARGPIVDEAALSRALAEDELAGAGLDVMPSEPPSDSPLFERDDVVLTPHAAWYSEQSIGELRTRAARNVVEVLRGDYPERLINDELVQ